MKNQSESFKSSQEVKWCPGCGDYSILTTVQRVLQKLSISKERIVFVSGIGCSSRFPYYMNTYGFHTIHGRAPAVATGIKLANPELSVWLITGDGDGFSIGTNHMIHLLRRNIDINILLFNNEIYGLTKGQVSPTSRKGTKTKTSLKGVKDRPVNPIKLATAAGATFIARTMDKDPKHMAMIFEKAVEHKGSSFIEIYQNCVIFNDGVFDAYSDKGRRNETKLELIDDKPLLFDAERKGVKIVDFQPKVVDLLSFPKELEHIHIHKEHLEGDIQSNIYSEMTENPDMPTPFGVFRKFTSVFSAHEGIKSEKNKKSIEEFISSGNIWTIS